MTAERLVGRIAARGAPPLAALASELEPPHQGAWYEAGLAAAPAGTPGPETLMLPVVVWSRAWHGPDREALVGAAVSTARLTHSRAEDLGAAAAFALALSEVAEAGAIPGDLYARVRAQLPLVERWAGGAPRFDALRVIEAATKTGEAASDAEGLLGALQGLGEGTDPATAPPAIRDAALRIASLAGERC